MHHHEELMRMEARLARLPDDGATWLDLARYVARRRILPELLDAEAHGPLLLALWRAHPDERALATLVLPLLRLHADPARDPEAAGLWRERAARAPRSLELYDPDTGLPVHTRRRVDGGPMALVPAEGPEGSALYLGITPVSVRARDTFLRATGEPEPPPATAPSEAPARFVDHAQAERYAWWVGGRLPTREELARARDLGVAALPDAPAEEALVLVVPCEPAAETPEVRRHDLRWRKHRPNGWGPRR